jgi:hypothetical protein
MNEFKSKIYIVLKDGIKLIAGRLRLFLTMTVLLFGVIWLGYTIRVIGSREICDSLKINIITKDNIKLVSQPQIKLSHAGNIVPLIRDENTPNTWIVKKVFIEKVFLAIQKNELKNIQSGTVVIGSKSSFFSNSDLTKWQAVGADTESAYFANLGDNLYIVQFPTTMHSETSKLPFFNKVFGEMANWAGDSKLIVEPLVSSAKLFILTIVSFLLYFFILFRLMGDSKNLAEQKEKLNFLSFSISLFFTIVILGLLNLLIKKLYHPDLNEILNQIRQTYLSQIVPSFVPKPVERLQFVLSTAISPFVLVFFYYFISKRLKVISESTIDKLYKFFTPASLLFLVSAIFCGVAANNFFYLQTSYALRSFGAYIYTLLLFPVFLWFTFSPEIPQGVKKIINFLPTLFMGLLVFSIFSLNIFSANNIVDPYHFNPVFYPMAQVAGGKALLVGFTSFYGLFPIFINVFFWILGFSVLKFSIVLSSIFVLSYFAAYKFLKEIIKNKLVLIGGLCSLFIFSYSVFTFYGTPVYFQYWPIRFFPPCVLILLGSLFLRSSNKKNFYYSSFIWCFASLLWNLETGAVMLVAWLVLLVYSDLSEFKGLSLFKKLCQHLAVLFGGLLFTIGLFFLYTLLKSGTYPNFGLLGLYQKLFFSGYFLINIPPLPHVWGLVILIYLAGLLYSVRALFFLPTEKSKIIFFLSVLGLGLFSYYEGRSQDLALIGTLFPAVLLLTIFADQLLESVKNNIQPFGNIAVLIIFLFIIYSAPVSLLVLMPKIIRTGWSGLVSLNKSGTDFSRSIKFVEENSRAGEKIFIVAKNKEGIYYGESKTISVMDLPSSTELVSKADFAEVVNFLKQNTTTKVFADIKNPASVDEEINLTLKNYYTVVKTGGDLGLLIKKTD